MSDGWAERRSGAGSIVRRLLRASSAAPGDGPGALRIAELTILDAAPASSSGAALTKAGRLSLRGTTPTGARVKVVEAHSAAHARMVALLSDGDLSDLLPPVLGVEGTLVVTAWVEGAEDAPPPEVEALAGLLARFHATPVPTLAAGAGFDAWRDHVLPRAHRAAVALGRSDRLEAQLAPAHELAAVTAAHVQHPDLTPDNVLVRIDGGLCSIDNELLGIGTTPGLDLANLARGLREGRSEVVAAYRDAGGAAPDADALAGLRAMWLARMLGTWFVAGRLADANALLDAGAAELRLPFER